MNKTVHLDARLVPAQLRAGYRGKRFKAVIGDKVTIPRDAGMWQDGSRDTYRAVRLSDGAAMPLSDGNAAWAGTQQDREVALESGVCVICHTTTRGHDWGLTIYMSAADAAPMLPAPVELSAHERIVLSATKRFKPSYAGRDRYQMAREDAGYMPNEDRRWLTEVVPGERFVTRREWDAAKQSLIDKGLITKLGGLTTAGRNAMEDV